jgi:hypothetical protein
MWTFMVDLKSMFHAKVLVAKFTGHLNSFSIRTGLECTRIGLEWFARRLRRRLFAAICRVFLTVVARCREDIL